MKNHYLFVVIIFSILLSGCANIGQKPAPAHAYKTPMAINHAWHQHQKNMLTIKKWHLTGRAGVRAAQQSGTVSINWQQNNQQYALSFNGPFGELLAQLNGKLNGRSTLLVPGKPILTDDSGERLIWQATGWDIPFTALRYWILGVPIPNIDAKPNINNNGRLNDLKQLGWAISYSNYVLVDNFVLPANLSIANADISVRLVIRWTNVATSN